MINRLQQLGQLQDWFVQSLTWIYGQAVAVEQGAGSSPGWQQALATFDVAPISDQERQQVRAAQRPIKGAPVMELHAVITAVIQRTRHSLHSIDLDDAKPLEESMFERLRMLLDRTENELITAYKRAVLPQRQGGMFGNVLASHTPSAAPAGPAAHSLTCQHCGAPRLSDRDFECPYCGQHMAQ